MTTIKLTKNERMALEYINYAVARHGYCKLCTPRSCTAFPHLESIAKGATIKALINKGMLKMADYIPYDTPDEFARYVGGAVCVVPTECELPENIRLGGRAYRIYQDN